MTKVIPIYYLVLSNESIGDVYYIVHGKVLKGEEIKTVEGKILATDFLRFFYYIFTVSFIYMKSNQYVHIICILFFAIINTYRSYAFPLPCSFFIEL